MSVREGDDGILLECSKEGTPMTDKTYGARSGHSIWRCDLFKWRP